MIYNVLMGSLNPTHSLSTRNVALLNISVIDMTWGTSIRGLMRGMVTLPRGKQEVLVVRDKVGRPPGELGVSKSMECVIFPSVL